MSRPDPPFLSLLFSLIPVVLVGCNASTLALQEELDEAEWSVTGCADIVLLAVNQDGTVAIELQMDVETSELVSTETFPFILPDGAVQSTLFEGELLGGLVCGDSSSGSTVVSRSYLAGEGEITLVVTRGANGGRVVSALVDGLTFVAGRDALRVDLEFTDVVLGQYDALSDSSQPRHLDHAP